MTELTNSTDYLIFFSLETTKSDKYNYRVMFTDPVRDQLMAMHRTQPPKNHPLSFDDQRMLAHTETEFPEITNLEWIVFNARA